MTELATSIARKAPSHDLSLPLCAALPVPGPGEPQAALSLQLLLCEMQVERSITHGLLRCPRTAHSSHVVIQAAQAAREICRRSRQELHSYYHLTRSKMHYLLAFPLVMPSSQYTLPLWYCTSLCETSVRP